MENKVSFEASLAKLEEYARRISDPSIPLEEAIRCYEEGLKEYNICRSVLDEAKQKIETIGEENRHDG
ncbi:MAG: exodeoxyribonuclease VII small subunit [Clostridiales bacterium]|nr:exodeoxyribonuclease VII small subunit [Clostridiales bacterium]